MPWDTPAHISRPGIVGIARDCCRARRIETDAGKILEMCRRKERAGIQHEDPEVNPFTEAVQLLRAIAPVHASADHDNVEGQAAVGNCFKPRIANPSSEQVVCKGGLLNVYRWPRRIW